MIILWHGPGMTPYDCTFHKRRDAGTNLHEDIFRVYDGREKGDLSKTVFDLPDLMQHFEQGKVAFIANQQYRETPS